MGIMSQNTAFLDNQPNWAVLNWKPGPSIANG